ncbi:hypothetical protein HK101_010343 [Irineochytrium annulatum]|nr:hypothetical protein HK101_010343 [Irineochytrium annulatum]
MERIFGLAASLYAASPKGLKAFFNDVVPYGDVTLYAVTIGVVILRTPQPKASLGWGTLYGFIFLICAIGLYYHATMMAISQHNHAYNLDPEGFNQTEFAPHFPLDLTFGYTPEHAFEFFKSLGADHGRSAFSSYLTYDLVAILSYVGFHMHLISFLYPETESMAVLTSKIPLAMGSLDLYETIGLQLILWLGGPENVSAPFLARIISANSLKFAAFWGMLGLEVSGFMMMVMRGIGKEIKDSGVTVTGSAAERKAEERRKARLSKKGK